MGGQNDTKEEHAGDDPKQQQGNEQSGERGNSGHGASSALAHMISQGREHRRHHIGEADDAAGVNGQ